MRSPTAFRGLDPHDLWLVAAEAGPGFRGRRRILTEGEAQALADAFRESGAEPPAFLERDTEWVDREAKLFEAGKYPDKGVEVTRDDIVALAANFREPVPVLIEHAASPLDLGYLTDVEARGDSLFGTISLTREADSLVRRSGAKALSLGVSSDLRQIREVSLVRHPRVADARLFCIACRWDQADPPEPEDGIWRRRCEELEGAARRERREQRLSELVRAGRLVPAQVPFARAILGLDDTVEFDGSRQPIRELFIAVLERQPPLKLFGEIAPTASDAGEAGSGGDDALLLPEEAAFYRRYFPDVRLDEIAQRKLGR
ncbi:MAG: hypothetical protein SNJ76_10220 [Fimbriimonadaceae bacterium]